MVTTATQAPSRRFPSMIEMASQAPSRRFPSMIEMAETASIRSVAPSYISEVPSYHSDRYSYADPYNLPAEPAPPYSPPAAGWDMAGRLGVLSSLVPATLPDPPEEPRRERSRTRTRAGAGTSSSGSTSRGTSRTASRTSGSRTTSDSTTATTTSTTRHRNRLGNHSAANDSSSTIARLGNNQNRSTTNMRTSAAASSTSLPTTTTTNAGSRPVAGTRTRAQTTPDTPSRSTNSSSPPPRVGLPPVPSGPPSRTDFPVLGDFRIPSLSSMSSNPNLRQYQNVAQRRAAANASTTNLDGLRRALDRIEEERNNPNPSNNAARPRPLEDPYLVGEEAAAKARRERLARENGDILIQENHRWDLFLNLMREQEERQPGWRRFRKNMETRTSKLPFRLGMRAR
ncbi:hypothetical protein GE21DRAFT_2054 [Neurospora crassa]|uniref:Uncharacterized protein n=1 Tax=Neurospora crassa (strain ATCC 24698 / 74-OR23-1A / CBS 708.71 / DSM 1257 / FGSC 987) TaxID=367110 RepID=Q7SHY6_NEUCR|nr:hypothetical protein NCU00666 [Neurospora crassa OR74A]EAA36570.1 hypothetical protein NCU00666 [Neurospora crassa OR74A]KHE89797.1 hypothetical protein GE21DRAFT_2054 [Neurospora crassa]|eukprot:XP_965806.1 hypothetical protein NCU00666 [Neurospora crassa OR74A]